MEGLLPFWLLALVFLLFLSGIAVWANSLNWKGTRRECPSCSEESLRHLTLFEAAALEGGQSRWSLHECEACGVRLNEHRGGEWIPAKEFVYRDGRPPDCVAG